MGDGCNCCGCDKDCDAKEDDKGTTVAESEPTEDCECPECHCKPCKCGEEK